VTVEYLEMMQRADDAMHDVAQLHLDEFRSGARGPYPEHDHSDL
jgi:hypothetical protein